LTNPVVERGCGYLEGSFRTQDHVVATKRIMKEIQPLSTRMVVPYAFPVGRCWPDPACWFAARPSPHLTPYAEVKGDETNGAGRRRRRPSPRSPALTRGPPGRHLAGPHSMHDAPWTRKIRRTRVMNCRLKLTFGNQVLIDPLRRCSACSRFFPQYGHTGWRDRQRLRCAGWLFFEWSWAKYFAPWPTIRPQFPRYPALDRFRSCKFGCFVADSR